MKISEVIALRIRQILKQRKMTQYKLEQISCISHNTMINLLNGRYNAANMRTVFIIINSLGMTIKDFFDDPLFDFEQIHTD